LQWIVDGNTGAAGASRDVMHDKRGRRLLLVGSLIGAAALAGVAVGWATRSASAPSAVTRWAFRTPTVGMSARVALSRDAQAVVYDGVRPDGVQQLYLSRRDQLDPTPIRGTEGASQLALSPDAVVLFVAGGRLLKVPAGGGPVQCATHRRTWSASVGTAR
jgi:hypothetical protein